MHEEILEDTPLDQAKRKSHHLILGPFQPALEEGFLHVVKSLKDRDRMCPLVVLVGSSLLGLYLRRLLVQHGISPLNIRFLTIIALAPLLTA
jgi:hypothetical protein